MPLICGNYRLVDEKLFETESWLVCSWLKPGLLSMALSGMVFKNTRNRAFVDIFNNPNFIKPSNRAFVDIFRNPNFIKPSSEKKYL